jgi:amino acid adenylation domain-containing protein
MPAYVLFTSGSTGVPKGVVISHHAIISFIDAFVGTLGIRDTDRLGNQAPFDFDVSTKDIYSTLAASATLVIIPRRLFMQPADLAAYLEERRVTVLIWAVAALCLVSTYHALDVADFSSIRTVMFSGETMPKRHLKSWRTHLPQATFVNLYGPTEITCNCTWHRIDRTRDYPDGIPIGRSFENEETFLLDDKDREITQPGVTGEICVRGTAVGLGYWNMEEQTRERFRKDPRTPQYASIIYCTGDLGCYNEEGELLFRGRKDDQIKYMGHRIELAEVELAINRIPGVERSCCIFDEKKDRLHGFYCGSLARKDLALALKQQLPVFMIPGILHQMDALPVTGRGKIDRKALKETI